MNQSAEVRSALEFFATAQSFREGCQAYKNEVYLLPTELDEVSQRTHREHSPNGVVGKVPVQSLRVSSVDRRTAARGQTVKQCTELQSALDFFSTRQLNGAHSSQSPSCLAADGVFSLIAPRRHVCASAPRTVVDAHSSLLYVGSNASQLTV